MELLMGSTKTESVVTHEAAGGKVARTLTGLA